ncbi:NADP-dependent oxidoreductase [Adhaeretor mobilis]|uniref:NADP-dependent oxidoreductase YfmJ n=1 Tax=Adhaeretor mobilis TaxID=1930276 RepID=A0A517N0S0_9BACT|nr:NADP-dependent oxidoreductase [Adhaeretor mobilis]QDT00726.1 Putative NADP-dependent oxidoreductase YfmJ [Adhaeretor mobilis]
MKSREVHLQSRPQGIPKENNFVLTEATLPNVGKGEFLVRNEWFSVDPYMRGRMREGESYVEPFELNQPMEGGCLGKVESSNNPDFQEGDYVLGNQGWRECWISDGEGVMKIDSSAAPPQAYLSVLGMTGMTAYVGLTQVGNLQDGERVFVSAASGAVGSIVCQIAKAKGCFVIGSAGSTGKIAWLKENAGVDKAFNYHETNNISQEIAELSPDGIDLYFDNVGGDHLQGAIDNMNDRGRIVCCGMISTYNEQDPEPGPNNLFKIIGKRIRMEGFIVRDHMDLKDEFVKAMQSWIQSDQIVWKETITEGLENAPQAFINLLSGEKLGKALVKV